MAHSFLTAPSSVFLEIQQGQGNGLTNRVKSHVFNSKQEGLDFVSTYFQNSVGGPFRSPFCELLGWSVEIYCSATTNTIYPPGRSMVMLDGTHVKGINGAGVYFGCDLYTAMTMLNNMDGPIFVTGRNRAGETLSQACLWGILNFIGDCMDLYGDEDDPQSVIRQWANEYREKSWEPSGGYGGIEIYNTSPLSGLPMMSRMWSLEDHRLPARTGSGT